MILGFRVARYVMKRIFMEEEFGRVKRGILEGGRRIEVMMELVFL